MRHGKREKSVKEYLIGFLLGIVASLSVGSFFFYLSSQSLRQEAENLRNMVNILGRGLESQGLAKFNWDKSGNMKGVVHFLTTSINVKSRLDVKPELEVKSEKSKDKHE